MSEDSGSEPEYQSSPILTIGIQGGKGSFNEEAARFYCREHKLFPDRVRIDYLYTSPQVMAAVEAGTVHRGQCAIYNSAGGWVDETVDALKDAAVSVVEEFEIRIAHCIMLRSDQTFEQIETLMCHPQVFAQCNQTLKKKYPNLKQVSGKFPTRSPSWAVEAWRISTAWWWLKTTCRISRTT
jgi:prephenate dehydratase